MLIARKSLPWRIFSELALSSTAIYSSYLLMARSTYSYILGACKCDLNFCCQKTWKYVKQEIGLKQRIYRRRRPGSGRDDLKRANGNWFVGSWGNNSLECLVSYFSTFSIHWDNRPFYKLYKLEWDYFWTWTTTQTWPFESFQNLSFLNTDTWKIHISTRINIDLQCDIPLDPPKRKCALTIESSISSRGEED